MKEKTRRKLIKQIKNDPSSVNDILHKHKELRHLTMKTVDEEEAEKPDIQARIGKTGKTIPVNYVTYPDRVVEAVYHVLAHMAAIRDVQGVLKDTPFYSSKMEKLFDEMLNTKLSPMFKQNDPELIKKDVTKLAKRFSNDCDHHRQLSKQPKVIQDRFYTKFKDLLIETGITLQEYA